VCEDTMADRLEAQVIDLADAKARRWFNRLPHEDQALVRDVMKQHPGLTLAEALEHLDAAGGL